MVDLQEKQLENKYRKNIERIINKVYKNNKDLITYQLVTIHFYKDSDRFNHAFIKETNHKAYCNKDKNIICLSDTVCEQSDSELFQILLHELIHLTYKEMNENEVISETHNRIHDSKFLLKRFFEK